MNKTVEDLLNKRLATLEDVIKWKRGEITEAIRNSERQGRELDALNQEKRAIKDHLEVAK